jgi:hypothetical protein
MLHEQDELSHVFWELGACKGKTEICTSVICGREELSKLELFYCDFVIFLGPFSPIDLSQFFTWYVCA